MFYILISLRSLFLMCQYADSALLPPTSLLNGLTSNSDLSFFCIDIFVFIYSGPDFSKPGTEA